MYVHYIKHRDIQLLTIRYQLREIHKSLYKIRYRHEYPEEIIQSLYFKVDKAHRKHSYKYEK